MQEKLKQTLPMEIPARRASAPTQRRPDGAYAGSVVGDGDNGGLTAEAEGRASSPTRGRSRSTRSLSQLYLEPPPKREKAKAASAGPTEPKSHRLKTTFVPPMPTSRRSGGGRQQEWVVPRKFKDVFLHSDAPMYPKVVSPGNGMAAREASYGMMLGTIASLPMGDLRNSVGYMLANDILSPRGVYPGTGLYSFVGIEKLDERDGGMDILMNEVRKMPVEQIAALYDIAGRIRTGASSYPDVAKHSYRPRERVMGKNSMTKGGVPVMVPVSVGKKRELMANVSPPAQASPWSSPARRIALHPNDDPSVYTKMPNRSLLGNHETVPGQPVDICGPRMNRWTARTAREQERVPDLAKYQPEREEIGELKRLICGNDLNLGKMFLEMSREGVSPIGTIECSTRSPSGSLGRWASPTRTWRSYTDSNLSPPRR